MLNKPTDPIVKYENEVFLFDFSMNPDYNIFTSFYYSNKLYEMGLPTGRTYEGIWFELVAHYLFYKADVFDLIDNDNIADMGNYANDNNAWFFECFIHFLMEGLESVYYDEY